MLLANDVLWLAQTNTWVVARERGAPALIIDAPPDPSAVVELVERLDVVPTALLLTHGHVDHMGGAEAVCGRYGLSAYVHPDDDFLTLDPLGQLRALFGLAPASGLPIIPGSEELAPPANRSDLEDGEVLELAGLRVEVRHTPGHTPGHCCFLIEEEGWLFSGDQLFAGSIGRTDLPGGDFGQLMASMRRRVLDLPDDTRVLPGHGPETTVGRERRTNPFLLSVGGS